MQVYLVGGAVRDEILGIANTNTEKDYVVVGSSVEQMLSLGYRQVGKAFPVFLHPQTKQEYALARVEKKTQPGYHGFEFDTSKQITLEQDLSRRDLTINAIAKDELSGQLFDPFHGQEDLQQGLLRHVSKAFGEDPVRVLRVARFAARFQSYGFRVAHPTHQLMKQMVQSGELDALVPERILKELNQALSYATPSAFFKILSSCGAYERLFPMLKLSKKAKAHENNFTYLDGITTDDVCIKFALWLHNQSLEAVTRLSQLIKCSKPCQQLAELSAQHYDFVRTFTQQSSEDVFTFFTKTDALRRKNRFDNLLQVFELLEVDTTPIVNLAKQLGSIDASKLNQTDITLSMRQAKLRIIQNYFSTLHKLS